MGRPFAYKEETLETVRCAVLSRGLQALDYLLPPTAE